MMPQKHSHDASKALPSPHILSPSPLWGGGRGVGLFLLTILIACASLTASAQTFHFSLDGKDKTATRLLPSDSYTAEKGYGFDFVKQLPPPSKAEQLPLSPFFLSVKVPDGNYKVTLTIGSKKRDANTTVRAESRRLFLENIATKKGEQQTLTFVVNKRDDIIRSESGEETDRVKTAGRSPMTWDDKLTLEITGSAPAVSDITIQPADSDITTVYLCGNSTVVDQDREPWASWGQMITRWFDTGVAIANYAESGRRLNSFTAENRLKKILSLIKPGDYLLVEFGHNDQKEKTPGAGAYYNFAYQLKLFVDEARLRGAIPVFCTPTQRRFFDQDGHIQETHGDYPDAMREVAKRESVPVIELHDMTRTLFETLGTEGSKQALVHYPAGTFPGQTEPLADNTHFNPYGAYEVACMVAQAIRDLQLPLAEHLLPDFDSYNPSRPHNPADFRWTNSPFFDSVKPEGN